MGMWKNGYVSRKSSLHIRSWKFHSNFLLNTSDSVTNTAAKDIIAKENGGLVWLLTTANMRKSNYQLFFRVTWCRKLFKFQKKSNKIIKMWGKQQCIWFSCNKSIEKIIAWKAINLTSYFILFLLLLRPVMSTQFLLASTPHKAGVFYCI